MLPRIHPKAIPRKIGIRFGWFRRFIELPNTFSAWLTANSLPTIVTRSPICNCNWGLATRSTPERLTRVTLAPKLLRIFNCANVLPFSSGLVIRIRREISSLFSCSHSTSIGLPKNAVIASISIGVAITNISSPRWSSVSEFTNSDSFFPFKCRIRDTTKLRFTNGRISLIRLPWRASLRTSNETGRTVNSCKCPSPCSASASSCLVLIRKRYLRPNSDMMHPTTPNG